MGSKEEGGTPPLALFGGRPNSPGLLDKFKAALGNHTTKKKAFKGSENPNRLGNQLIFLEEEEDEDVDARAAWAARNLGTAV